MLDLNTINAMSRQLAITAAAEAKHPFVVEAEDLALWKAQVASGKAPHFSFPALGEDYRPAGWRKGEYFTVNYSPSDDGGTLGLRAFVNGLVVGHGYAVADAYEFCTGIQEYIKDGRVKGNQAALAAEMWDFDRAQRYFAECLPAKIQEVRCALIELGLSISPVTEENFNTISHAWQFDVSRPEPAHDDLTIEMPFVAEIPVTKYAPQVEIRFVLTQTNVPHDLLSRIDLGVEFELYAESEDGDRIDVDPRGYIGGKAAYNAPNEVKGLCDISGYIKYLDFDGIAKHLLPDVEAVE